MFQPNDEKYIKRLIGRNEVVLFLGSGFSRDAQNSLNEPFPTGSVLASKIWDFMNYPGVYDGTSLPEMFQAFLMSGFKKQLKIDFLNSHLLSGAIPEIYNVICAPLWYKIYTLNVDDILNKIYKRTGKSVQDVVYPKDEFVERDQSLNSINAIYLHGKLPCDPSEIVFSTKQYAKTHLKNQPLYSQFVYDYAVKSTIFIGTELNEPIFERYIEAREGRDGYGENRPKSFLITPTLSPVKADIFKNQYNVHHVKGSTETFLIWLKEIINELPTKQEVLKNTFPNLLSVLNFANLQEISTKSIYEFAKSFNRVNTVEKHEDERSSFLLGASPTWNDIYNDRDVPRTISDNLFNHIEDIFHSDHNFEHLQVTNILGTAGSGKTTILKRIGLQLSKNGRTVFFSYSQYIPRFEFIIDVLSKIKEQVILIFDNAKNILPQLELLIKDLHKIEYPPIIIISVRTNQSDKLNSHLDPELVQKMDVFIPDLDDVEIINLINQLDKYNLLGVLKGLSSSDRFREFKYRAKKQILIAMKEATKGKNFNDIIKDEYFEINPNEAKILCLCIALNTELGFTNSKQDYIGFSSVSHAEALSYLNNTLAGTIIWVGNDNNKFMLRHQVLAEYIISFCATIDMLKESYIRVLSILAPELKKNTGPSRKFSLYKSLINHQTLYQRFKNNIDHARDVYDSISTFFNSDSQFWLQYGSLEVEGEGGDLNLAENYLAQAASINPYNPHIKNAQCNLYYRLSLYSSNFAIAMDYKIKADEFAKELLANIGTEDPHIHHIYCRGNYYFIQKWIKEKHEKTIKLEALLKSVEKAVKLHPRNRKIDQALQAINRAYLQLSVSDASLSDPEIPQ